MFMPSDLNHKIIEILGITGKVFKLNYGYFVNDRQ